MYEKKKQGTLKDEALKTTEGHKNEDVEKDKGHKNDDIKTLIQEYVTEAVNSAKMSWEKDFESKIAGEREEAARLATMTSEERAKAEMEKMQKAFETEREQYVSERAEFEAAKELSAQNLPVKFAKMVAHSDHDTMVENIETFKVEYMKAIESGLSERLKGVAPKISREKEKSGDPFLNGLGL